MYKTTGSPQLSEYVNYSLRDEGCMDGIQLDSSPSQPHYRVFSMNQSSQKTRSHSGTPSSNHIPLTSSTSRSTTTQDLAEFLKTSSPQGYKRFLGSGSSEDLASSAVSQKRSFRFLKSSTPKNSPAKTTSTSIVALLPNKNVVSKTTSRGKPYLQIQVDYANNHFDPTTDVGRQMSLSSGTSSGMCRRDSVVTSTSIGADSSISSRASCSGELPRLSPRPPRNAQESRVSLDLATMGRYQQFLDSGFSSKAPSTNTGAESYSFTSDIVSAGMAELRAFQNRSRVETPPYSPRKSSITHSSNDMLYKSPEASPSRHSRPSSTKVVQTQSQGASARSSVASDIFDDITDTEFEGTAGPHGQRKKSRKAPPRPGPPPNRSLPSLPEGHDDPRPDLEGRGRKNTTVWNSRISFTSTIASSVQLDDAESIRSDRKSREERVKARKAKDINQHIQLMREKKQGGKLVDNHENLDPQTSHLPPASSDSSEIGGSCRKRSISRRRASGASGYKSNRNSSIAVAPGGDLASSTNTHFTQVFNSRTSKNDKPQLSVAPASPTLINSTNYHSAREMELEARMVAVERKNKMLEQALMAVIRSAVRGQAQRRTELFKANGMEELLDELDLDEFPVASAAGGQLV